MLEEVLLLTRQIASQPTIEEALADALRAYEGEKQLTQAKLSDFIRGFKKAAAPTLLERMIMKSPPNSLEDLLQSYAHPTGGPPPAPEAAVEGPPGPPADLADDEK